MENLLKNVKTNIVCLTEKNKIIDLEFFKHLIYNNFKGKPFYLPFINKTHDDTEVLYSNKKDGVAYVKTINDNEIKIRRIYYFNNLVFLIIYTLDKETFDFILKKSNKSLH